MVKLRKAKENQGLLRKTIGFAKIWQKKYKIESVRNLDKII